MTLIRSKVTIPGLKEGVVRRDRLIEPMLNNVQRKITFITAPAGYGKTTLANAFISELDEDIAKAWYQIADNDTELNIFFQYFYFALAQEFPALEERARSIAAQDIGNIDPDIAAEELLAAVEQHVDKLCVLVLDDFQFVSHSTQITKFLNKLLEFLPDVLRIVILSRTRIGLPIPKLQIRGDIFLIDRNALAFQEKEVQQLSTDMTLSSETISSLLHRTEGWAAALVLTVDQAELTDSIGEQSLASLYGFLVDEVLENSNELIQTMLTDLSVVDEFDEATAKAIQEQSNLPISLNQLEKQNQFVVQISSDETTVFRFHQLFREAIQERFAQQEPERFRIKKKIAANLKREAGEDDLAVRYYLAAEEVESALEVIEQNGMLQRISGNDQILAEWHEVVCNYPQLADRGENIRYHYVAHAHERGEIPDFRMVLEPLLRPENPVACWRVAVAIAIEHIAERNYDEAREVLSKYSEILDLPENVELFYSVRPSAMLCAIDNDKERLYELVERYIREVADNVEEIEGVNHEEAYWYAGNGLLELGFRILFMGDSTTCEQLMQRAIELSVDGLGIRPYVQAQMHNNLGYVLMMRGQFVKAWDHFEISSEYHRVGAAKRQRIDILSSKLTFLAAVGAHDAAQSVFTDQILQLDDHWWEVGRFKETYDAVLKMASETHDLESMRHLLGDSLERNVWEAEDPLFQFWLAVLRFHEKEFHEAQEIFDLVESKYEAKASLETYRTITLLWHARTNFVLGDVETAHRKLDLALELNSSTEHGFAFVVEAAQYFEDVEKIHAYKGLTSFDHLQAQIQQFQTERELLDFEVVPSKDEQPDLQAFGFGRGEVQFDGDLVEWGKGHRQKAVFFYILENPGVRRQEIGLTFWPDASEGRANQSVYSTITRIRQKFKGADVLQVENEGYEVNEELLIDYDVRQFEDLLGGFFESGDDRDMELLRRALRLYKGDFLSDVSIEWVEMRRDELKEKYLKALEALAIEEFERSAYPEAAKNLEHLLKLDPFREEAQIVLMRCYIVEGKRTKALKHYEDYKQRLQKELNVEPDSELHNFAESLRAT